MSVWLLVLLIFLGILWELVLPVWSWWRSLTPEEDRDREEERRDSAQALRHEIRDEHPISYWQGFLVGAVVLLGMTIGCDVLVVISTPGNVGPVGLFICVALLVFSSGICSFFLRWGCRDRMVQAIQTIRQEAWWLGCDRAWDIFGWLYGVGKVLFVVGWWVVSPPNMGG